MDFFLVLQDSHTVRVGDSAIEFCQLQK